jgi:hypothetical protein
VKETKKIVAGAQKARKQQAASAVEVAQEEQTTMEPKRKRTPTTRKVVRKGKKGRVGKQTPDVSKEKQTVGTEEGSKTSSRVEPKKRKQTAMELKAVTKSGVLRATDSFGCRHLGVMQLFGMSKTWYTHYLHQGEFLHGEKCQGSTCGSMPAERILEEQGKSKSDGTVLYYCDEGCKAMHSNDPDVLKELKCNFFLCHPCYLDRMESLDIERKQTMNGGVRKSTRNK